VDTWGLLLKRDDHSVSEIAALPAEALAAGEIRVAVERFGLTTNNATYIRFGDDVEGAPFWEAFPGPVGYGRPPVWACVRVEESRHPDVRPGSRYFGYAPLASHHVLPVETTDRGLRDTAPHREFLHPWYREYVRLGDAGPGDRHTLLEPVFPASFNLADLLERRCADGARAAVITSASSKVAVGLAAELAARQVPLRTIGVTSARHLSFVDTLGVFDTVVSYDTLSSAEPAGPTVFIDLTGDDALRRAVCTHLGDMLLQTALVGFTHPVSAVDPARPLPGPPAEFFFTPAVEAGTIAATHDYYPRYQAAMERFIDFTASWLTIRHRQGPGPALAAVRSLLAGDQHPDVSDVFTP